MNGFIGDSFGRKIFGFIQSTTGGGGGQPSTTIPDGYTILGDGSNTTPLRSSSAQLVYENVNTLQNGKGTYLFTDTPSFFVFDNNSGNILNGQRVTLINLIFSSTAVFDVVYLTGINVNIIDENQLLVTKLTANSIFEFVYTSYNVSWNLLSSNRTPKTFYSLNFSDVTLEISSTIIEITFDSGEAYGNIIFPDPTLHLGEKIYIYNSSDVNAPISTLVTSLVPLNTDGTQITSLAPSNIDANCYIFTAQNLDNSRWVLTGGLIA